MLEVLVIDDEKLVRQMIIRCIDWEEIGLHIAGEASSARMGMEMIDRLCPDLVFMDVKMPGMDGLTCSRLILEKDPQIKIFILSGHDEFEYASEGIRIGVFDYLLKPINASELRSAVIKAKEAILNERSRQKEFEYFKEELKRHSSYIRDRQLGALVLGRSPGQHLQSLSYFGVEIRNTVFQVALIEIRPPGSDIYEEEKILMKMHARKIAEDYYGDMPGVFLFDNGGDFIILLNNESEAAVYDHGEELKQYLKNNTESMVLIGVGNVYTQMEKICESYREAQDSLKYRFVSGEDEVICFRDIYPYYDTDAAKGLNEDAMRELANAVRISDVKGALDVLDAILDQIKRTGGKRDLAVILSVKLLAEIMRVLSELRIEIPANFWDYPGMIEGIFALRTFGEIRDYLIKAVREACFVIGAEVSDKEKSLVHKVKDYMTEHYPEEEISLNSVARVHYVNSSYLSRVFKEKTGSTFSGYLFDIRMKEAQRLILRTDLRSYEIAERVGIPDPHYFSSCFKRHTGMSVSEYKKQGQKE